jgi:hypothetical protein
VEFVKRIEKGTDIDLETIVHYATYIVLAILSPIAIGGFVVVGQMIDNYRSCKTI